MRGEWPREGGVEGDNWRGRQCGRMIKDCMGKVKIGWMSIGRCEVKRERKQVGWNREGVELCAEKGGKVVREVTELFGQLWNGGGSISCRWARGKQDEHIRQSHLQADRRHSLRL